MLELQRLWLGWLRLRVPMTEAEAALYTQYFSRRGSPPRRMSRNRMYGMQKGPIMCVCYACVWDRRPQRRSTPIPIHQAVVRPHMRPSRCEAEGDGDARLFVMGLAWDGTVGRGVLAAALATRRRGRWGVGRCAVRRAVCGHRLRGGPAEGA